MSNPFTLDAIETKKHLDKDKELENKIFNKEISYGRQDTNNV